MFGKHKVAMLVAEFIGTATLTTAALVLTRLTSVSFFVSATVGVTLGLIVLWFGWLSGAHVNPAVTLGLWTVRKVETTQAIAFIAVQLLGGLSAWRLYEYLSGVEIKTKHTSFDSHMWVAEMVGAFLLVLTVTSVVSRGVDALQSAAAIGSALFLGTLVASVASAGIINPAVAIGLRQWGTVYMLAPLVGGVIAANLYMLLFAPEGYGLKPVKVQAKSKPKSKK